MATTTNPPALPSAQVVGDAFVEQYYCLLHKSPEMVYKFYQSVEDGPGSNGVMSAFNEMILSLDYKDCKVEIKTVDAQDSYKGGVIVLVTGCLTTKKKNNNVGKKLFTQSFFLAPQHSSDYVSYFVVNDVFRYVDVEDVEELHVPKRKKTK